MIKLKLSLVIVRHPEHPAIAIMQSIECCQGEQHDGRVGGGGGV